MMHNSFVLKQAVFKQKAAYGSGRARVCMYPVSYAAPLSQNSLDGLGFDCHDKEWILPLMDFSILSSWRHKVYFFSPVDSLFPVGIQDVPSPLSVSAAFRNSLASARIHCSWS